MILEYSRVYGKKERMPHLVENPKWALVYWNRTAMVYVKRGPKNKLLIQKFEYKYARPNALNPGYLNKHLQRNKVNEVLIEFKRNLEMEQNNEKSHLALAYVYYKLGRPKKELEEMEMVVNINPKLGFAHSSLGELNMQKANLKLAEDEFGKALKINPQDKVAIAGLKKIREN